MKEFIEKLDKIYEDDSNWREDGYSYKLCEEDYDGIESLACDNLITDSGDPNYENIRTLKNAGYRVFPVEKDSFGWLVGAIQKDSKYIYFG